MGSTLRFVTFLSLAITMAPCGEAVRRLPAPEHLSYKWIDGFVVDVTWSWPKPQEMPEDCVVFEIRRTDKDDYPTQVENTNFTQYYLSEDLASGSLELNISSKPLQTCSKDWNESEPVKVKILPQKLHAELVKDFKCYYLSNIFNCSWYPVDPSEDLKVSYRVQGRTKEDIKSLKVCKPEKMEDRKSCSLEREKDQELFVLVETETRMTTFKPKMVIHVPEMSVLETEASLSLTWTNPVVGKFCTWHLCLWYKECENNKSPLFYDLDEEYMTVSIPHNKCCGYEFQYNMSTNIHCREVISDTSKVIRHGTTKTCPSTANMVAVVIPIIVFCCMVLSFYCFRKNQDVLNCPNVDTSTIKNLFKGNQISQNHVYKPEENTEDTVLIQTPPTCEQTGEN